MRAWCNRSLHQRQVSSTVRRKGTQFGRRYFTQSSLLIEDRDSVQPKIGRLVLVRHGQSEWNVTDPTRGLTARFVSYSRQRLVLFMPHSFSETNTMLLTETIIYRRDGQTLISLNREEIKQSLLVEQYEWGLIWESYHQKINPICRQ